MADESVLKLQGKVPPRMFIGLGGAGSRIVDRMAARAKQLPYWDEALRPLTAFVSIDTDINDQNLLEHVPRGNKITIGAFDKHQAVENYRKSGDQQALQWLDKAYRPRPGGGFGAGQIRVESRLGFHYSSPQIRERFSQILRHLLEADNTFRLSEPPTIYVYLYATLAGGTGSGCFLTTAYLLQDVIRSLHWRPRVLGNYLLSTTLLNKVAPDLHQDIHANTYAALKELEHLTKIQYPDVAKDLPNGETFVYWNNQSTTELPRVKSAPFYYSSIYDLPPQMAVSDIVSVAADATFWQAFTPIIGRILSEADNYEKHLTELTRFPGDLKNVGRGYAKNFGAFGLATLVLPAEDLHEYSALRFAAEALRRQITFGVSPESTDDRARALERLQVNYEDPKFRNMAEEDRYREINKAFVLSVQAMAQQDERDEITNGYWQRLVEDADLGRKTGGVDDNGDPRRADSLVKKVRDELAKQRDPIVNRVSIKQRTLLFHQEGVNQYSQAVNGLLEDIRKAAVLIDEGLEQVRGSAAEGDVIRDLKLDPMQERYLVLRLLDLAEKEIVPEVKQRYEKTEKASLENPKMKERLEVEFLENLRQAADAKKWGFRRDDETFKRTKEEAQDNIQKVGKSQKSFFDAKLEQAQYKELLEYMHKRSHLYARLATRMNDLVQDMESEAEAMRRGANPIIPRMALTVEVFETLDKPRRRIWPEVYRSLFIDGGRDMTTYDRNVLSKSIAEELKPVRDPGTGRFVEKSERQAVIDLRQALVQLGRDRLRRYIYGDDDVRALNIETGLELEARILTPGRNGEPPSKTEIDHYVDKKLVSFSQLAGVTARLRSEELDTLDDGVKVAQTRHYVIQKSSVSPDFDARMRRILERGGREPQHSDWSSPHIAIVHDMELPIPLYYFAAVVGEIENAYERVAANERRAYHLHTDYHWEKALPNLNPRKGELSASWALDRLVDGLLTQVVVKTREGLFWQRTKEDREPLGENLAAALYTLGEYHLDQDLGPRFKTMVDATKESFGADEMRRRAEMLKTWAGKLIEDIAMSARRGENSRQEELDQPVLRVILTIAGEMLDSKSGRPLTQSSAAAGSILRDSELSFDAPADEDTVQ